MPYQKHFIEDRMIALALVDSEIHSQQDLDRWVNAYFRTQLLNGMARITENT